MDPIMIGPGPGCAECGGVYGKHTSWCPEPKRRKMHARKLNVSASRRLRDAFASKDPQEPFKTIKALKAEGLLDL